MTDELGVEKSAYRERCALRWSGRALRNALRNWEDWQELHPDLCRALKEWRSNPTIADLSGMDHCPSGTLVGFLWLLARSWAPSPSSLGPLLDFEEHFQTVHLRRGIVQYCGLVLESLDRNVVKDRGDAMLGF